jgi:hypothetical protein
MNTRNRNEVRELTAEGEQMFRELTVAELDEVTGASSLLLSGTATVVKSIGDALATAARKN